MASIEQSAKPYRYFRLHTHTSKDPLDPAVSQLPWSHVPSDNNWRDGYHYFGRIKTHSIKNGVVTVSVEPLVQAQWDSERELGMRALKKFDTYEMSFEKCISLGDKLKSRMRFKSTITNELFILSSDKTDEEVVEGLIKEITDPES